LKKLVAESINEIRQLSATIRTPAFDQETLVESIEKLSANINRLKPVNIVLDDRSLNENELENDKKLMIYRVVQEQVNNIIKYAEATTVEIKLDNTSSAQVQIRVRDDGRGFDPAKVRTGIGLRNIQSRLQVYNGNLIIHSSPGNGCLLEANFPA
jgi:two-component system sensor histidine kinase UhpB